MKKIPRTEKNIAKLTDATQKVLFDMQFLLLTDKDDAEIDYSNHLSI